MPFYAISYTQYINVLCLLKIRIVWNVKEGRLDVECILYDDYLIIRNDAGA